MPQNERVKELRKRLGLSLEKFGENLGVGKTAISKIERGENNLSDQMFKSICREYGVREEWLRNGTGEPFGAQTRNEEILMFANKVMAEEDDSFKKRLVNALSELKESEWEVLEQIVLRASKKND